MSGTDYIGEGERKGERKGEEKKGKREDGKEGGREIEEIDKERGRRGRERTIT